MKSVSSRLGTRWMRGWAAIQAGSASVAVGAGGGAVRSGMENPERSKDAVRRRHSYIPAPKMQGASAMSYYRNITVMQQ
ncbi:hypothetical protein SBA_ch1_23250 [Sphingomonas bisphenolicum]|uniref:Secreted protein n=1 Tax=Sphingomonas bisphenolicum TaxID=296544 RepID=A0ABM7FYB4_9SPHN|nr:hypothetical protein SBA_ch1_23250 [Sphingomonas bisphenolicum]